MILNEDITKIIRQCSLVSLAIFFVSHLTLLNLETSKHFLLPEDHTHSELTIDDRPYNRIIISGSTRTEKDLYQARLGHYNV